MIKFTKKFKSYEGEGPNIGIRTLFLTYEKNTGEELTDPITTPAVYINTDFIDIRLYQFLETLDVSKVTLEMPLSTFIMHSSELLSKLTLTYFIRIDSNDETEIDVVIKKLAHAPFIRANFYFKLEATMENFYEQLELANKYSHSSYPIYLMPLFNSGVGEIMMKHFDKVEDQVFIMPPTQFLINIS